MEREKGKSSTKQHTERLIYGRKGLKGAIIFRRLPRASVDKLKDSTLENVQVALNPHLKKKAINAILIRKELLLKEIEEMIQEVSEDQFLY